MVQCSMIEMILRFFFSTIDTTPFHVPPSIIITTYIHHIIIHPPHKVHIVLITCIVHHHVDGRSELIIYKSTSE